MLRFALLLCAFLLFGVAGCSPGEAVIADSDAVGADGDADTDADAEMDVDTDTDVDTDLCPPDSILQVPASCPNACTGGCIGTTCFVDCEGLQGCSNDINCPDFMDCTVRCTGLQSCDGTTIRGPANGTLFVECNDIQSCNNSTLQCTADDSCLLLCSGIDNCQGSTVNCGAGPCVAECTNLTAAIDTMNCGPSCDCLNGC
jgi:hypothetical protein